MGRGVACRRAVRRLSVGGDLRVNDRAGQRVLEGVAACRIRLEETAVRALLHNEEDELGPARGRG